MPFDPTAQLEAYGRVAKLAVPAVSEERELGNVIGFASTKPGSGGVNPGCAKRICNSTNEQEESPVVGLGI